MDLSWLSYDNDNAGEVFGLYIYNFTLSYIISYYMLCNYAMLCYMLLYYIILYIYTILYFICSQLGLSTNL